MMKQQEIERIGERNKMDKIFMDEWIVNHGLQDLKPEIKFLLTRLYTDNAALLDLGVHDVATDEIVELLMTFWEELGEE